MGKGCLHQGSGHIANLASLLGVFRLNGNGLVYELINVFGVRETSFINIGATIIDIATQVSLVIIGFILIFDPTIVWHRIIGQWPTTENLILGIALATIAYTGIETMSQMA